MLGIYDPNDIGQDTNKFATAYLPFKCAFCILNFATKAECHSHNKEHFKEKCNICNVMIIEIAGCWFELKLHTHENLFEPVHDDRNTNTVNVATESDIHTTGHCNESNAELAVLCETLIKNEIIECNEDNYTSEDEDNEGMDDEIAENITNGNEYTTTAFNLKGEHRKSSHSAKSASDKCDRQVMHSNERPFTCTQCNQKFKLNKYLAAHMKRVHLEVSKPKQDKISNKKYSCHLCGENFNVYNTLKYHVIRHSNEYNQICSYCNKAFTHKLLLNQHVQTVHKKMGNRYVKFKCASCNKIFDRQKLLNTHIVQDHNEELPYKCNVCGKISSSPGNLKEHLKTHSDNKKEFICNYCGKVLSSLHGLTGHINAHTGKRPYECKECGKKFTRNVTLRKHLLVHTGEKPCKCKIEDCNAAYMYDIDLKRHLFSAHGIYTKKYECPFCQKIYSENKLLKKHLERHQKN